MKTVLQWLCDVDENKLIQNFQWECAIDFWLMEDKSITVAEVYKRQVCPRCVGVLFSPQMRKNLEVSTTSRFFRSCVFYISGWSHYRLRAAR